MNTRTILLGVDFGRALVEHFQLPLKQVQEDIAVAAVADEVFGVTLKIALTANDLAAIAQLMPGATPPAKADGSAGHTVTFNPISGPVERRPATASESKRMDAEQAARDAHRASAAYDAYLDTLLPIGIYKRRALPSDIGFDAWMRARTDAAHAAYMAGHAAGGIDYPRHASGSIE